MHLCIILPNLNSTKVGTLQLGLNLPASSFGRAWVEPMADSTQPSCIVLRMHFCLGSTLWSLLLVPWQHTCYGIFLVSKCLGNIAITHLFDFYRLQLNPFQLRTVFLK